MRKIMFSLSILYILLASSCSQRSQTARVPWCNADRSVCVDDLQKGPEVAMALETCTESSLKLSRGSDSVQIFSRQASRGDTLLFVLHQEFDGYEIMAAQGSLPHVESLMQLGQLLATIHETECKAQSQCHPILRYLPKDILRWSDMVPAISLASKSGFTVIFAQDKSHEPAQGFAFVEPLVNSGE